MAKPDLLTRNLRELKNIARLTENQFAELIGKEGRDSISKYFSRSIPPPDVLRAISKVFKIDLHKLLHYPLTKDNYKEFLLDPREEEVLSVADVSGDTEEMTLEKIKGISQLIEKELDELLERGDQNKEIIDQLRKYIHLILNKTIELYDSQEKLYKFLTARKPPGG